jgi:hypothetical protein
MKYQGKTNELQLFKYAQQYIIEDLFFYVTEKGVVNALPNSWQKAIIIQIHNIGDLKNYEN